MMFVLYPTVWHTLDVTPVIVANTPPGGSRWTSAVLVAISLFWFSGRTSSVMDVEDLPYESVCFSMLLALQIVFPVCIRICQLCALATKVQSPTSTHWLLPLSPTEGESHRFKEKLHQHFKPTRNWNLCFNRRHLISCVWGKF